MRRRELILTVIVIALLMILAALIPLVVAQWRELRHLRHELERKPAVPIEPRPGLAKPAHIMPREIPPPPPRLQRPQPHERRQHEAPRVRTPEAP